MLPGLYSVQAIGKNPQESDPDVTVYRMSAKQAVQWQRTVAKKSIFDRFLLRHGEEAWDVYDAEGKLESLCYDVLSEPAVSEAPVVIEIDREYLQRRVRNFIGDDRLSLIACAEAHPGASAADHSNFVVMCRRMILDAKPPDLEHVYVVEPKEWDCRVVTLFADVSSLSTAMQDMFLDRVKWIKNNWPMVSAHWEETFADRLARSRIAYVSSLLRECAAHAGMTQEMSLTLLTKWSLASVGSKYVFAQHIVRTMKEGVHYTVGEPESFDPEIVKQKAGEVVKDFRTMLR